MAKQVKVTDVVLVDQTHRLAIKPKTSQAHKNVLRRFVSCVGPMSVRLANMYQLAHRRSKCTKVRTLKHNSTIVGSRASGDVQMHSPTTVHASTGAGTSVPPHQPILLTSPSWPSSPSSSPSLVPPLPSLPSSPS
jgi:hypothetical protein